MAGEATYEKVVVPLGFLHPPWQHTASAAQTRPWFSFGPGKSSAAGGPSAWTPRPQKPRSAVQSSQPAGSPERNSEGFK